MSEDGSEIGTRRVSRGDSALSAMYVISVLFLFVASLVVVVLMYLPSESEAAPEANDAYIPGSLPRFTPITAPAGLLDPPGLTPLERGRYRLVIEGYNWEFNPKDIRLPVGAEVEIVARSSQDYHGMAIVGTDIVLQLVRNDVARATHVFSTPGEYPILCAEYCGAGHGAMTGLITVE